MATPNAPQTDPALAAEQAAHAQTKAQLANATRQRDNAMAQLTKAGADLVAAVATAQKLRDTYQVQIPGLRLRAAVAEERVAFLEQLYAQEHGGAAAPPTPLPPPPAPDTGGN